LSGVSRHTYDTIFDLFFTRERMIAFIVQSPDDVSNSFSRWNFLMSNYFDKHKQRREQLKITEERKSKSKTLNPEELVAAHPSNFDVDYKDISSIEIAHRLFEYRVHFQLSKPNTQGPAVEFLLRKEQVILAQDLFKKILPAKFKE
jgi:hypothetical protein